MFSSMFARIGRVMAVAAMASTAVALVPQQASAFVFGGGGEGGGMMGGGGNSNYGAGTRGHVPGYFGSTYGSGGARTSEGPGGRRVTHGGGVGSRHQPHGGFAGRDASKGAGFGARVPRHGIAANPAASVGRGPAALYSPQAPRLATTGQPRPVPTLRETGARGPARQFGRLGPAAVEGGPGYRRPAGAPDVAAPPPVVYQAPVAAPVATVRPPVYQPPAAPTVTGPVATNPAPVYPTYQPTVPVAAPPPPQSFVAKAPAQGAPAQGAPATCTIGSYVTVAFQANVTTEDVKTFLSAYNVVIASGPEADGSFRIQLSTCPLTPAEMTQVVDSMRSQTAIIARVGV